MDLWIVACLMGMAALLQITTAVATISAVTKECRQAAALAAMPLLERQALMIALQSTDGLVYSATGSG